MKIETRWEYSLETETLRLIHCAHQIAVGFYRVNNFVVLPYKPNYKDFTIVTFPDLPYTKIPRFWEKAKRLDIKTLPIRADKQLVQDVRKLLLQTKLPSPNYSKIEKLWSNAQSEIINEIYKIIPSKKDAIKKIIIYPTTFGTSTSFNKPKKFPTDICIYLRNDQDIYALTEAILTPLTRHDVYTKFEGVWQESELLVDWLVSSSSIGKILRKYQPVTSFVPTLKYTRVKQRANLLEESERFYKKLGVPIMKKIFSLKENEPTVLGNSIENLTIREKEILSLMIKKGSQITTIDEMAQILFKDDEDAFSLQAIAKTIQRLRDKLEANGVSGSFIQTKRGEGYLLVN